MPKLPQPSPRQDPLILLGATALLIILLAHLVTILGLEANTANGLLLALAATTGVMLVMGRRLLAESLSHEAGIPRKQELQRRNAEQEEAAQGTTKDAIQEGDQP